jgi:TetR/AcrR family transcriptional repressor of uid operon
MTAMPGEFPAREATAPSCVAERILTAAADLCTLVGVKHITIADIARRAEVDVDSVYEQWRSVGELVIAVVIRDLQQRIDVMAKLIRAQATLDDKIVEAFASMHWFLDSHPMVGGALRSDADIILATEQSVSAVITIAARLLVESVGGAVRDDSGTALDIEPLEEVTTRLIQSLLLAPTLSQPMSTRADVARYARRCFVPLVHAMRRPDLGDPSTGAVP